ncbi:hypothetical protein DdX_04558 [Ditylenchus destructor]|uniref:Uncharacterized protein n=1 Tax=Ditylenchus destructor TaxID=166010 RepID=A0AAD4N8I3_9BILA|nr:hypothetical protein DdX_04558 [Ditylenchus destructor]
MSHFAIVTVLAVSFVLAQAVPIALPSIPSGNGTVGSVVGLVQATLVSLVQALIAAVQALLAVPGLSTELAANSTVGAGAGGNIAGGTSVSSLITLIQALIAAIQSLLAIPEVSNGLSLIPIDLGNLTSSLGGTLGNVLGGLLSGGAGANGTAGVGLGGNLAGGVNLVSLIQALIAAIQQVLDTLNLNGVTNIAGGLPVVGGLGNTSGGVVGTVGGVVGGLPIVGGIGNTLGGILAGGR